MPAQPFFLPNSPNLLVTDRFSLLEGDAGSDLVPFWNILIAILSTPITCIPQLIDQLETVAITLRTTTGTDYGSLSSFLAHWRPGSSFFTETWPAIVSLALELPALFPAGELTPLQESHSEVSFSRRQAACLVIHQFLCSLPLQPWATDDSASPDFHIWYSSEQPHPRVVNAYLTALFTYFERLADVIPSCSEEAGLPEGNDEWPVTFTLHSLDKKPFEVIQLSEASTAPSVLGLPRGAAVISANKHVGFGRSGTQEETHVGSSPEACLAVLLTPTLKPEEVMVVRGAEAMVSIIGYGRDARLGQVLPRFSGEKQRDLWSNRTMLFMDALELDEYDPEGALPDLLPGHVDRELQKAYTAFSSFCYTSVFTGLWGCGTFAGNSQIKTVIQWCAASLAGVELKFVCHTKQAEFAAILEEFVETVTVKRGSVGNVLRILRGLGAEHSEARNVFKHIMESIKEDEFELE